MFIEGTGQLFVDGHVYTVEAPAVVHIPGDAIHAMTPLTDRVVLGYAFPRGPFACVEYTYLQAFL